MPDDFDFSQPRKQLNSGDSRPLLTYLLCALSVLVTLAWFTSTDMPGTFWYRLGHLGMGSSAAIWDGHYYFLVTAIFNHLSIGHIVFNMLWLVQLGSLLELTLKPWQYALFILGAAIVGSCGEMAIGSSGVGMSGVVYAIFGLLWAGRGRHESWRAVATRQNLNLFIGWGILCVFLTYFNIMRVGNGAHGAGFLYGLCIGWLFFAPRRQPLWAIPLVALAAMCVLALTWLPWSAQWQGWKESQDFERGKQAFEKHEFHQAIGWFEKCLQRERDDTSAMRNIEYAWHNLAVEAYNHKDLKAAQEAEAQAEQAKRRADAGESTEAKTEAKASATPAASDDAPLKRRR